jgi:hypothetical protein
MQRRALVNARTDVQRRHADQGNVHFPVRLVI